MTQPTLLKVEVPLSEIPRKATLGKAIEYCAELAGYSYDKTLEDALQDAGFKVDATQLTRWRQGGEGIKWDKFAALMDTCGNDAPLMWMLHQRGYDLHSLRRRQTETEQKLAAAEERIRQLEAEARIKADFVSEVMRGRPA